MYWYPQPQSLINTSITMSPLAHYDAALASRKHQHQQRMRRMLHTDLSYLCYLTHFHADYYFILFYYPWHPRSIMRQVRNQAPLPAPSISLIDGGRWRVMHDERISKLKLQCTSHVFFQVRFEPWPYSDSPAYCRMIEIASRCPLPWSHITDYIVCSETMLRDFSMENTMSPETLRGCWAPFAPESRRHAADSST